MSIEGGAEWEDGFGEVGGGEEVESEVKLEEGEESEGVEVFEEEG